MNKNLFDYPLEKRVAVLMDFDLTLTEEYQQIALFQDSLDKIKEKYNSHKIKNKKIEINSPLDYFKISDAWSTQHDGLGYIQQMLFDMNNGVLPPLSNRDLREYGKKIKLSEGVPEFMKNLREEFSDECYIGFYIVSVGLSEMIKGTGIDKCVDGIYATDLVSLRLLHNKFSEKEINKQINKYGLEGNVDLSVLLDIMPVDSLRNLVQPFSKTACVIDIAKGGPSKRDNLLRSEDFLFNYNNMIFIGDGTSDISSFAYLKKKGATTIGVYKDKDTEAFEKASGNSKVITRLDILGPRNYNKDYVLFKKGLVPTISKMIERKCEFPPLIMDMYKKNRIRRSSTDSKRLIKAIEDHGRKCKECNLSYNIKLLLPE